MWMSKSKISPEEKLDRELSRDLMRSAFRSLFWNVFSYKKKHEGYALKAMADHLCVDKSLVSRWFSNDPNWSLNTVADIASALNVEIKIMAIAKDSGTKFGPAGEIQPVWTVISGNEPSVIHINTAKFRFVEKSSTYVLSLPQLNREEEVVTAEMPSVDLEEICSAKH